MGIVPHFTDGRRISAPVFSHYLWQDKMMINGFPVVSVIVIIAAVFFRSVAPSSSTGSIVHAVVDKNDFDKQLTFAGGKLVVVNFSATWCGPCKMMAPTFEAMSSSRLFHHVVFLTVDVDDFEDVAKKYNISALPTFLFIKNKAMVDKVIGANVDKLKELVTTHM